MVSCHPPTDLLSLFVSQQVKAPYKKAQSFLNSGCVRGKPVKSRLSIDATWPSRQLCIRILTLKQSLGLLKLPTEILVEICKDPDDLASVRLACRRLCDAVTPLFAVVNFTERVHVVTPYSIGALIDITEHAIFGEYVKVISVCSVRQTILPEGAEPPPPPVTIGNLTLNGPTRTVTLNGYVTTKRFARDMERVFRNIKSRSGSVSLRFNDYRNWGGFGGPKISDASLPVRFCHGWKQLFESSADPLARHVRETLEETIYAARRARCPVRCLKITLAGHLHVGANWGELDMALRLFLESSLTPLNICLVGHVYGHLVRHRLFYDHESQSLELERYDVWLSGGRYSHGGGGYIPLEAAYTWLLTQRVARLSISKQPSNFEVACFRPFFSLHLTHLEISTMTIWTDFDRDLWSDLIEELSGLTSLRHCELSKLKYRLNLISDGRDVDYEDSEDSDNGDTQEYFVLPGHGQYLVEENSWSLKLLFADGTDRLELDGDDTCEKLRKLAYHVREAEDNKRQTIVRDKCARGDVVRVFHQVDD
jgi:hypothetical protein